MRRCVPLIAALVIAGTASSGAAVAKPLLDAPPPIQKPTVHVGPGIVTQVGEIVVMEGDDEIVTTLGGGDFGVDAMDNIANRFYLTYPDEFDGIAVFTTFPDQSQGGAAYALLLNSGFQGLGYPGGASPMAYGSAGRLISLTNMNDTNQYGSMDEDDIGFHSTFGQEFGHSWLSFVEFIDPVTSMRSRELLGRDDSHWSAVFASGASVMDGVSFTDNGNGTFTVGPTANAYGPLDLYAMGIIRPNEVGPLFVLRNATYQDDGSTVDPVNDGWRGVMSTGRVVVADKLVFSIDDVIAAHGPRVPAADEDNEDFRIAFILVTKPGETAEDVADRIAKLEVGRLAWEKKHRDWTSKRSTMCTDVTALCPLAFAEVGPILVNEDPDKSDGDGIIEPGERIEVVVTFTNEGSEAATSAMGQLVSDTPGVVLPEIETLPEIPIEGSIQHTFHIQIDGDACGEIIDLEAQATISTRSWRARTSFRPGVVDRDPEQFATDAGWIANATGGDTAAAGGWEHGIPDATFFAGRTLQPDGGAGGPGDAAWFTGPFDRWDEGEVGGGATTLTSAPYDLRDFFEPTLRYKVWYLALDRPPGTLLTAPESHFTVEVSDDGGGTWVEIDRVEGDPVRWETREIDFGDRITSGKDVRFRFTAFDDKDATERLVEVGIDDVAVISLSNKCTGSGGGGCCSAGQTTGENRGAALLALGTLLVLLGRRRRRQSAAR